MHAHWAHALSLQIAEKANGLVFPPTYCCFTGATRAFRGTVSFTHGEPVLALKRIASTLSRQGFRRTVLVGGTNPEDTAGMIAARELFDETEIPTYFISARRAFDLPEVSALWRGIRATSTSSRSTLPRCGFWDGRAKTWTHRGRREAALNQDHSGINASFMRMGTRI